ncbi:sodium:proton antiporter [Texcoconibacillus texcoconensis]|nr:sodium:proton antiporter [Texcoconibacillus texcoconensis]
MNQSPIWTWLVVALLAIFGFRYRYKVVNLLLTRRFLRRVVVRLAMRIPAIRQSMMQRVLN